MEITPIDVIHAKFKKAVRGYSVSQVDEFLQQVSSTMEACARERAELREKVERLSAEVNRCREIETTMQNALILAQKTADELKASAHKEAELVLREAEQTCAKRHADAQAELAELKSQITAFKDRRDRFESDFKALMFSCSEWLQKQSSEPTDGEDS
ncbi:MAG: DivIVA domain-containing protein [Armatimonadota bacterium]|nr:DivIVA domain-containing protein [Armatimonadota bacterium]